MEGVNAGRKTIPFARFDGKRCAQGLESLRSYRTEWDEKARAFKKTRTDERLPDLRAIVAATTLQSLARESLLASLARRQASAKGCPHGSRAHSATTAPQWLGVAVGVTPKVRF
jgi:hypothetical protein